MNGFMTEYFIDTEDTALLHVAALIHPDVISERVFAYNTPFNWNVVLAALRKLYPEKTFREDEPGLWDDLAIVDVVKKRAEGILRDLGKEAGFTSLEESLKANLEGIP